MSNFVTDLTGLPFPKSDLAPVPFGADPTKFQTAGEWNTVCQALLDLRDFVLGSQTKRVVVFVGNSNFNSAAVSTDQASRQRDVLTPNAKTMLDKIYGTSSGEPVPLVDMGRGVMRAANVSSFPGYGPSLSFAREFFGLLNGFSAAATAQNRPWTLEWSISGVQLFQMLKTATYGQSTPAFNDPAGNPRNAYGAFIARVQALLAATGLEIALFCSDLGPNDGADATLAGQVAAHWVAFWASIQSDLGTGFPLALLQMNPNVDASFRPTTVRPQMALAASQIPGCRLIDRPVPLQLATDNIHYQARRMDIIGMDFAAAARDQLGLLSRTSNIVAVRGFGEPEYTGNLTLDPIPFTAKAASYPLTQAMDLVLCVVGSMQNSGGYTAIPSPTVPASGWTSLGNSTRVVGGQTQGFALFSRPMSQADIDTGNHIPPGAQILLSNQEDYCKLFSLFGPPTLNGAAQTPILDGAVQTWSETSFTNNAFNAPGPTTTKANALVVLTFVTQGGGAALTEHFAVSNSNLTNLQIISDEPYALTTTNFGVLVVAVGTMVAPGPVGNTTITKSAGFNAMVCGFTSAWVNPS